MPELRIESEREEKERREASYGLHIAPFIPDNIGDGIAEIEDMREVAGLGRSASGLEELTGDGQVIVVMDSGVDDSHPILRDVDVGHVDVTGSGRTRDKVGHGTACAGLIHQVAPGARIISLRVFDTSGRTDGETIKRAYQWLIDNSEYVDVVNMSWGASKTIRSIDKWHNQLSDTGVIPIVSAGNSGGPSGSPATATSGWSVGACDEFGEMADFSSYNPEYSNPEVTAVGKNTVLPRAENTSMGKEIEYITEVSVPYPAVMASGTSFSGPQVAAIVSLLRSAETIRTDEILSALTDTARDIRDTETDGEGIVDYLKARLRLRPQDPEKPEDPGHPEQPDPGEGNGNGGKPPNVRPPRDDNFGAFAEPIGIEATGLRFNGIHQYTADIYYVTDGDSMKCKVSFGFSLTQRWVLRLLGVDTAEIYGVPKDSDEYKKGAEHRQFVQDWVERGKNEYDPHEGEEVEYPFLVKSEEFGKYGNRRLAVIKRRSDGSVLNQALIDEYGDSVRYGE